jgi:hypothetical protein
MYMCTCVKNHKENYSFVYSNFYVCDPSTRIRILHEKLIVAQLL